VVPKRESYALPAHLDGRASELRAVSSVERLLPSGYPRRMMSHAAMAHAAAEKTEPRLAIRDPYIFEFLGLRPEEKRREMKDIG